MLGTTEQPQPAAELLASYLIYSLMYSPPFPEQAAAQEAEMLLTQFKQHCKPEATAHLRDLLDRLDAALLQESIFNVIRLQKQDFTEAWQNGAGHYNSTLNHAVWRQLGGYTAQLMREFKEAATTTFGQLEPYSAPAPTGLRTAYDPVQQVYLVYPQDVVGEGSNYSHLAPFYRQLLQAIPAEIEVVLFVKTSQLAASLRQQLSRRIRYVVHSELESIWLRDYAGFNVGTHLVKPVFSPRRIGDGMKLLHSLLGLDLAPLDLVWDGGNLVTNGRYGFISTRLLQHNTKHDPADIARMIQLRLGIVPVWVELPALDKLAHTDGYLAFISPTQALVSTYPPAWGQLYPEDQRYVDQLARQVQALGLEVERVLEYPDYKPGKSTIDSAVGVHVNLLQLNGTWLVPTYGHPGEEEMLAQLQRLNPAGTIVPLDCTELAQLGGVLHCMSFCN